MPLLEDLLLRFRRVWAPPGPVAGQAGVPEDLGAHVDDELRELTAELNAIDLEGQELLRAAQIEAASITDAARIESERLAEEARLRVPEVRAGRAAQRVLDRQAEIDGLLTAAEKQAAELRARARSRMPPVVDEVAAAVFAGVDASEVDGARVMGGG